MPIRQIVSVCACTVAAYLLPLGVFHAAYDLGWYAS